MEIMAPSFWMQVWLTLHHKMDFTVPHSKTTFSDSQWSIHASIWQSNNSITIKKKYNYKKKYKLYIIIAVFMVNASIFASLSESGLFWLKTKHLCQGSTYRCKWSSQKWQLQVNNLLFNTCLLVLLLHWSFDHCVTVSFIWQSNSQMRGPWSPRPGMRVDRVLKTSIFLPSVITIFQMSTKLLWLEDSRQQDWAV